MRKLSVTLMLLCIIGLFAVPAFAQAEGEAASNTQQWVIITSGFAMAIASAGCGLGQARAIQAACEGLARNPGAAPAIRFALLLGLVLIESLALYTLFIILVKY